MRSLSRILLAVSFLLLMTGASFAFPTLSMTETVETDRYVAYDNHTYDFFSDVRFYTDHEDGSQTMGYWIGTHDDLMSELSWSHTLPADLQVPPDIIRRATLWINGSAIDENGNMIEINGTFTWNPLNNAFQDNTLYDLTDVDVPGFWNNGRLDVSIFAGERAFRINKAALALDYTSVPEPLTFSLFGLGLLGIGIARRRR
ncbi:PEP-CTERM sorting domain-containing protein [bacterium]|nr:PEP-CTERM sorting domain-containing protein [bacterium]